MTAHPTAARTPEAAPLPRSRLRARLVLAGFAAAGLTALAWTAFVQPLPRLIYNPSDSVPVGIASIRSATAPTRCHVPCPWAASS